ncbi:hypothetical protein [Mycobacterium sp. URHB0021]
MSFATCTQHYARGFRPYGARADVEYHEVGVPQTARTLLNAKGVADVVTRVLRRR